MVDLEDAMNRLFPEDLTYAHHFRDVDDNGCSHVRSAFLKLISLLSRSLMAIWPLANTRKSLLWTCSRTLNRGR